jgi:hypothetical protein
MKVKRNTIAVTLIGPDVILVKMNVQTFKTGDIVFIDNVA